MYLCYQFFIFNSTVKFEDTNIFLACPLLWFDQSCGSFYTDNQTTCNFRIKCSTVASFLHTQNSFHPWYNLMWWRVCWFVQIDKTTPTIHIVYKWILVNVLTSLTCFKRILLTKSTYLVLNQVIVWITVIWWWCSTGKNTYLRYSWIGLLSGEYPAGMGV